MIPEDEVDLEALIEEAVFQILTEEHIDDIFKNAECLGLERPYEIADYGYNDSYRGWYDNEGCGFINFCRWVGNSGSGGDPKLGTSSGSSFWACTKSVGGYEEYVEMESFDALKYGDEPSASDLF